MKNATWGDPIGKGILDYAAHRRSGDIVVMSDICEDDIIPLEVLFRKFDEMPELEKRALEECEGKVLDVGAGAGIHAEYLRELELDVECIDISDGAIKHLESNDFSARKVNFFDLEGEKYDTILMLMNGIGIAGTLANLEQTLAHAKTLLNPGGRILCDSSDIKYLYLDDEGSLWTDLNSEYYGNFRFQMKFKGETGPWFNWLYVDFENLFNAAKNAGLKASKIFDQDDHYLAEIKLS